MDKNVIDQYILSCTDLEFRPLHDNFFEVKTSASTYTISLQKDTANTFASIVATLLPKLNGSSPLNVLLSQKEQEQLLPFISQLQKMGILFVVQESTAQFIKSRKDLSVYTYLARRTNIPEDYFRQLKNQQIFLYGSQFLTETFEDVLHKQGIDIKSSHGFQSLKDIEPVNKETALLVIIFSKGEVALLQKFNAYCHEKGLRWVPILVSPTQYVLGPWINALGSACYACYSPPSQDEIGDEEMHDVSFVYSPTMTSWSSLQPGVLHWVSGVFSQMVLRSIVPVVEETPWEYITTFDIFSLQHSTHRVWKRPYCLMCSKPTLLIQNWTEV